MSADPIVYCLERVTDYDQFERLCTDIMSANGFPNIEPLGGKKDKGRDAIDIDRSNSGEITIFAYSVREDWEKKLKEDAVKIHEHGHACNRFVFVCTATFAPNKRDKYYKYIKANFGWTFELYGIERLRTLLSTNYKHLLAKHPQIFNPDFFSDQDQDVATQTYDQIVIDHVDADESLADFLYRKLTLQGYKVWYRNADPIVGIPLTETMTNLIKMSAFAFISILSQDSVDSPDASSHRNLALSCTDEKRPKLLIPIVSKPFDESRIDQKTRQIERIDFSTSYKDGLEQLLIYLSDAGCPRPQKDMIVDHQLFMPRNVIKDEPENLLSNCFPITHLPDHIFKYNAFVSMSNEEAKKYNDEWAFRKLSPNTLLSFSDPPHGICDKFKVEKDIGFLWKERIDIFDIRTHNLIKELLSKSLNVICQKKGLSYCNIKQLYYFHSKLVKGDRLYFKLPNGSKTNCSVCGERKFYNPIKSARYRYSLAPIFKVISLDNINYYAILRLYIRLTDTNNQLFDNSRTILSRRKHLCKDWYNKQWLTRHLAIMNFLSTNGEISIGNGSQKVSIARYPSHVSVPFTIDEKLVERIRKFGESLGPANPLVEGKDENRWS